LRSVLDCSVAIKWFIPEPLSDVAERLLIEQQQGKLAFIAPDILIPEFTGTLASYVTSGDIEIGPARHALADLLSMHIELVPSESLARRAFDLSLAHSGSVYDAL
jgi:predicted nucleic acid-binding protein